MEKTYTMKELSMMTGFTTRTLRTYLLSGILSGKKVNNAWQFSLEDIDRFLSEPFVKEGLRIKRNSAVFDFLSDSPKKEGRACVILDLPLSAIDAQKVSAFFCEEMCRANDAAFISGREHGCFRFILTGAEEQVEQIMKNYREWRQKE